MKNTTRALFQPLFAVLVTLTFMAMAMPAYSGLDGYTYTDTSGLERSVGSEAEVINPSSDLAVLGSPPEDGSYGYSVRVYAEGVDPNPSPVSCQPVWSPSLPGFVSRCPVDNEVYDNLSACEASCVEYPPVVTSGQIQLTTDASVLVPMSPDNLLDGNYLVRFETFDSNNASIGYTDHNITINTAPPTLGNIEPRAVFNIGFGLFRELDDGSILSRGYGWNAFFSSIPSQEAEGVSYSAQAVSQHTGVIYGPVGLIYDEINERVEVASNNALFPEVESSYLLTFTATDRYGNSASVERIVHIDKLADNPDYPSQIVAVWDPNATGDWYNGMNGWVPYVPGMTVNTSPFKALWEVPLGNAYPETVFGFAAYQYYTSWSTERVSSNDEYAYFSTQEIHFFTSEAQNAWASIADLSGNFFYRVISLVPGVDVDIPPRVIGLMALLPNGNDASRANLAAPDQITAYRVSVEPRQKEQNVTIRLMDGSDAAIGTAVIPPGVVEVDVPLDPAFTMVGAGSLYVRAEVTAMVGDALSTNMRYLTIYYDKDAPAYDGFAFNESNRRLILNYRDLKREQGGFWHWTTSSTQAALSVNGSAYRNIGRVRLTESPMGVYTSEHNVDRAPDGVYRYVRFRMTDNFGNVTQVIEEIDITVDQQGPVITLSKDESSFNGGSIESLDSFIAELTDVIGGQVMDSVSVTGGILNEPLVVNWEKTGDSYSFSIDDVTASIYAGEYTLTLIASDMSGNVTTRNVPFTFDPPLVSQEGNPSSLVLVPAVTHTFTDKDGFGWLRSEPIVGLVGQHPVRVMLSADTTLPLVVGGVTLSPGDSIDIAPMDFDAMGGRYMATIATLADGAIGSGTLTFATAAPGIPGYQVDIKTWLGTFSLTSDVGWEVKQALEKYVISAVGGSGVECALTSDITKAQEAGFAESPLCLLEWILMPDEGELTFSEPSKLTGTAFELGGQSVEARISLVDSDGYTYEIARPRQDMQVVTAGLSFELDNVKESYSVAIENVQIQTSQVTGSTCTLTRDALRTGPYCLVEFIDLPEGLEPITYRRTPTIGGFFQQSGAHLIEYQVTLVGKSGKTQMVDTGNITATAVMPGAPVLTMEASSYAPDRYSIPVEGGVLGRVFVEAENGDIEIIITQDGAEPTKYIYRKTSQSGRVAVRRNVLVPPGDLWKNHPVTITVNYLNLPLVSSTEVVNVLYTPSKYVRGLGSIELDTTATDDSAIPIDTALGQRAYDGTVQYDPNTMGAWDVKLAERISFTEYNVISNTQNLDINTGESRFTLDFLAHDRVRLYALFDVISPDPDYKERVVSSNVVYFTPLKMTEIDADVYIAKQSGRAPYRAFFSLQFADRRDIASIGDITWQVRSEGGEWQVVEAYQASRKMYHVFPKGNYEVRAFVVNANSNLESRTPIVPIHAFSVPQLAIEGPRHGFMGSEIELSAITTIDGVQEPSEVIWSIRGVDEPMIGQTLNRTLEGDNLVVVVRARSLSAPEDNPYSYVKKTHIVALQGVRPPIVRVDGPARLETGTVSQFTATIIDAYNGMSEPTSGFWTLPDGSTVPGLTLNWSPEEDDVGWTSLTYTAQYDNYAQHGAVTSTTKRVSIWKYVWPEFEFTKRQNYKEAPTNVQLRWKFQDGYYVSSSTWRNYAFNWVMPDGLSDVVILDTYVSFRANNPGVYPVTLTISDDRGNSETITEDVVVTAAKPWEINLTRNISGTYSVPVKARYNSAIAGGHPTDYISNYYWYIKNPASGAFELQDLDSGAYRYRYLFATFSEPGSVEVQLAVLSNMGHLSTVNDVFNALPNQIPECALVVNPRYTTVTNYWKFNARCIDHDGRVVRYVWKVDGAELSATGSYVYYHHTSGNYPYNVELNAFDDAGGMARVTQSVSN